VTHNGVGRSRGTRQKRRAPQLYVLPEKGDRMRTGFVVVAVLALLSVVARAEDLKKLSLDDLSSVRQPEDRGRRQGEG